MQYFNSRYKIETARLPTWNYGYAGMYFITICTKDMEHFFGEISGNKIDLTILGEKVTEEWLKTPELRPDMNIYLGDFQVMPNHFHAILHIGVNDFNHNPYDLDIKAGSPYIKNRFGPQAKNLASVLRGFKSSVTKFAQGNDIFFKWQPRYHEHIIRNYEEYVRISDYIKSNVANWKDDKFYSPKDFVKKAR